MPETHQSQNRIGQYNRRSAPNQSSELSAKKYDDLFAEQNKALDTSEKISLRIRYISILSANNDLSYGLFNTCIGGLFALATLFALFAYSKISNPLFYYSLIFLVGTLLGVGSAFSKNRTKAVVGMVGACISFLAILSVVLTPSILKNIGLIIESIFRKSFLHASIIMLNVIASIFIYVAMSLNIFRKSTVFDSPEMRRIIYYMSTIGIVSTLISFFLMPNLYSIFYGSFRGVTRKEFIATLIISICFINILVILGCVFSLLSFSKNNTAIARTLSRYSTYAIILVHTIPLVLLYFLYIWLPDAPSIAVIICMVSAYGLFTYPYIQLAYACACLAYQSHNDKYLSWLKYKLASFETQGLGSILPEREAQTRL